MTKYKYYVFSQMLLCEIFSIEELAEITTVSFIIFFDKIYNLFEKDVVIHI